MKRNLFVCLAAMGIAGGMALSARAAAVDGTWIQPLNDNYNMSTAAYWQHAAVANGGGSVKFINQNSNYKKTLSNNVGTLTWNNVDLGASVFTLAGQPVVITGDSILSAASTAGVKFTNDVSFASGATVTKRGAGTVTFYNKVSAPGATLTLAEGKLVSTAADAFLTDAALNLRTGLFEWQPAVAADAVLSVSAGALAYGPDRAHVKVTKGNAASYAVTFASLARVDGGFLDLQLTDGIAALGETEKFLVAGRASDVGFIDASVISCGAGATGDAINFLVYDAEKGFVPAETAAFVEGQSADGKVAVISSDTTVSQDTAVSALLVENGAELTIASGVTLTVGDGVHPAGVIWRATGLASGAIKYWNGPGTLAFKDGSAGYFYYNGNSTQNSPNWTKTGRLCLQGNFKLAGTGGMTFAGAANVQNDYGTIRFATDATGWTGGTSVLGVRLQMESAAIFRNLSSPVRVLGDAAHGLGGQLRQNNIVTLAQDFTLGGPGVQLAPAAHSGFIDWGGSPYVNFDGRITLANDAAMNHDNKPSTANTGSLTARGGITGPGGLTLNWNARLDLAGPCDYTGKTILVDSSTGLFITGPNGTPGLGPVISKESKTPVVTFRRIDGLVASNDFTSVGGAVFTAVTNISFLGTVDFAKAEFCEGMTLGCGTNTVNFGVISQAGINVTAAADGGALTVGREGTDFQLEAHLTDGAHGERLGLVKTTSDTVTLYPGTEAATYTGPTSVRAGTLRLVDDPFLSGSLAYWLDADDASTIVTDGDGRVTRWMSKAGIAGLAFVPPTGSASFPYCGPTVSEAAINGRNALMFEADAGHFPRLAATNTVSGGGLATVDQKTVFILTRPRRTGVSINNTFIFYGWGGIIGQRCGAAGWDVRGPDDGTGETFDTTHGLRLDGVQRPGEGENWATMYLYHDAVQQILTMRHEHDFVVVNSYGTYRGNSRIVPSIGGGANYGDGVSFSRSFHGDIAEVIAFNRVLSEPEMRRVENYLAEKWGIAQPHAETGTLPAAISPATTLSVSQDATFDLNGVDTTVAGLEGYGFVTNSSETAATLTVTDRNAFAGTVAGNVTLVDKSASSAANCALRDGASLVVDGGRTAFGLHGDMPVTNGIAYWVDASHPETVQTNAQGHVTNWTCRAGSVASFRCIRSDYVKCGGQNYTYTAPERYDEAAFNGKPAVYFGGNATDGTNHMASSSTTTTRTLFLVCKVDGKSGAQEGFLDVGGTERGIMVNEANTTRFVLRPYTGTTYHKYGYLLHVIGEDGTFSDYTATPNTTPFNVPNTFILSAQCDETSGAFADYQNKTYYLGRGWHRGVRAWFGEVIGYERLLSEAEVADVEAYLKKKWFTVGPAEGGLPALAEDTSVTLKNGGAIDLGGAAATVDSLYTDASGGSLAGDVTLTGTLTVDFEGATSLAAPLAVDGDVTVTGARVEFLNFTNIVTDTWQPFLTATGTATGDFASDNLFGAYRRKKDGSSYALAHLTGLMIIFR